MGKSISHILELFNGGIHAKGSDMGGYPTYFTKPYPLWFDDNKELVTELLKSALLECVPEERELIEPVTKRKVTTGDKVGIDLDADTRGSLKFIQDNGFNQARQQVLDNIERLFGGEG